MIELWVTVLVAFVGTFIWRGLGVLLGGKLAPESPLSVWVNAMAYAMVAGVMMLIVIYPSGLAATTQLDSRLVALGCAIGVMLWRKNMVLAALAGLGGFLAVTYILHA